MTDADRFLATIIATPDDDAPRLVFADWLEEHGDADRAEFIRLQIAVSREPSAEPRRRADELLAANRSRWMIPGIPGVQSFHRGFVEHLHISADDLIIHADRIGTAAPIVGLRLSAAADRTVRIMLIPWLARLRRLEILNDAIGPRLPIWFRPGAFPELRSLDLRNNRLWAEHVGTLAILAANLPKLERLNLSGNPLGDEGLLHLASTTTLGNLAELVIASDGIDDEYRIGSHGIAAFATSPIAPRLRTLVLDNQSIGDAGLAAIAGSPIFCDLVHLDLSRNGIGRGEPDWVDSLCDSIHLDRLRLLELRNNLLSDSASRIREWSGLSRGCTVDLRGCPIPDTILRLLRNSVHSNCLRLDGGDWK
jgi:uncharacterized protein (TIGR02996 family)